MENHIEVVETAYEFLLAYAAQGREDDTEGPGRKVREVINELDDAMASILNSLDDNIPFSEVIADDIAKTRRALTLVSSRSRISS